MDKKLQKPCMWRLSLQFSFPRFILISLFLANIEKLLAVGIKNNRKGCQVYKSRMQSVPDGKG